MPVNTGFVDVELPRLLVQPAYVSQGKDLPSRSCAFYVHTYVFTSNTSISKARPQEPGIVAHSLNIQSTDHQSLVDS